MIKENKLYINRGTALLIIAYIVFLLITPDTINAIPSLIMGISRQAVLISSLLIICLASIGIRSLKVSNKEITIALIFRSLYYLFYSLIFCESIRHYFSYTLLVMIFPIVFFSIQRMVFEPNKVLTIILKLSVIIVGLQTAVAFLTLVIQGHGLYQIKSLIAIPLGNSNTIATIVVIQAILCYFLLKNKVYFAISMLTLLFTISRWGFISFAIVIVMSMILNSGQKHKIRNIVIYIAIIAFIYFLAEKYLSSYLSVYSSAINKVFNRDYSSLYNGRDVIFEYYKGLISKKTLLGYGLGIDTPNIGMTHNFIMQSLYFGGIVGSVLYYYPYISMIKEINTHTNKKNLMVFIMLIITLLINGFAENVFFTAPAEFISAVYIGLLYKKYIEKKDEQYDQQ